MRLHLLAVGTRMPTWVIAGYDEFARRLPRECSLHLKEIEPARRTKNAEAQQSKEEEAKRIDTALPKGARIVALDVLGAAWTTPELSQRMDYWLHNDHDVALVIGGPDGLAPQWLAKAHEKWSLSRLTFPHALVRVMVAEQVYRAWSILKNHPYHRE